MLSGNVCPGAEGFEEPHAKIQPLKLPVSVVILTGFGVVQCVVEVETEESSDTHTKNGAKRAPVVPDTQRVKTNRDLDL